MHDHVADAVLLLSMARLAYARVVQMSALRPQIIFIFSLLLYCTLI